MKASLVLLQTYTIASVLISTVAATESNRNRHQKPTPYIGTKFGEKCKALVAEKEYKDGLELSCETPNGEIYTVDDVSSEWVQSSMATHELISGETELIVPLGATVDRGKGKLHMNKGKEETPELLNSLDSDERRNLNVVQGTRTVLIVRVVAYDESTTRTMGELANSVFGADSGVAGADDEVNLRSQYLACSHGKLTFAPTSERGLAASYYGEGSDISNGAVTVHVNTSIAEGDDAMRNDITDALNDMFGVSSPAVLADHVMYCLPPGTMSAIAYAYINSWNSIYNDNWCTYVSAQMHEIGHNLNLAHSNEDEMAYNDQSGVMGFSYTENDGPLMCFNAAKSWQLGWYSDTDQAITLSLDGDRSYVGRLSGVVHYNDGNNPNSSSNPILIKLNREKRLTDFFITFNAKTGPNSGTMEGANEVLIVKSGDEGKGYYESELVAKLGVGDIYHFSRFDGSLITAAVSVERIAGSQFAEVSICIGDCDATHAPTLSPTPYNCLSEKVDFEVNIVTDNYPKETTWELVNKCNEETILSGGPYDDPLTSYSHSILADCQAEYAFIIHDAYGDGICCNYGEGSYEVKREDSSILIGGKYGPSEESKFGSCPSMAVPEDVPTEVLIKTPSASPSNPPSLSPTLDLLASPTKSPTPAPTGTPSSTPTEVPSRVPTVAPSSTPTVAPTLGPSWAPSSAPVRSSMLEEDLSDSCGGIGIRGDCWVKDGCVWSNGICVVQPKGDCHLGTSANVCWRREGCIWSDEKCMTGLSDSCFSNTRYNDCRFTEGCMWFQLRCITVPSDICSLGYNAGICRRMEECKWNSDECVMATGSGR
mmetsp:Transcript_20344/g.30258  ORF Transcript_20344/g.30258 Transcript_20344/m.30258 type:complete len:824 (-) Transcript_20344:193-2664(-)